MHKTPDKFALKVGNGNWNMAIPVRVSCGYHFWHRLGEFQVTKKCHENSGGYALCLLYIVMCAILRVVAYFLSVNLLHICTLSLWLYVWHIFM